MNRTSKRIKESIRLVFLQTGCAHALIVYDWWADYD